MAHVANLWVYPVKGFDRMAVDAVDVTDAGTFRHDRAYALVDPDADPEGDGFDTVAETFNAKEIDHTHALTSAFDPANDELTLRTDDATHIFDLSSERDAASAWFSDFADERVELRHREPPGFVDRADLGPSVISTGTLEEVASWFEEMTVAGARRRLRPNVEIGGVPPFWEDRFLGDDPGGFTVGDTRFEGARACARCVVPSRDPDTGEPIERFRQRFAERREATLPAWAPTDAFDHYFTVMLITRVPAACHGGKVAVGDSVRVESDA